MENMNSLKIGKVDFIESELIKLLTTSSIYCPECGNEMIEI